MNSASETIDSRHIVETAEGARLQVTVAGPIVRGLAWLVDATIRGVIFYALITVLTIVGIDSIRDSESSGYLVGLVFLSYFLLSWLYPIVLESTFGTTPGKKMFGLVVVHDNATPLSMGGSIIRNLLRFVDFLPMMYFVGLITALSDARFRRLGDLAAGTLVIYKDTDEFQSHQFSHQASAAPPNGLSREERLAIVDFGERSKSLSSERQQELAAKLVHLMEPDVDPVETLKCWAEWILRGQVNA